MTNYNDAAITAIFVSQTGSPSVQDDAPNSPNPSGQFDVTLEMVAGNGLASGDYTVSITCADLSAVAQAPASLIPGTSRVVRRDRMITGTDRRRTCDGNLTPRNRMC